MATHSADRAQRREAWLGAVLLFGFGCSVLGFMAAKDRLPWLTADHARATLAKAAIKVDDDLGRTFGGAVAR